MSNNEFTEDNTADATHADFTSSGFRFLSVTGGEIKYLNNGRWLELKDRNDIKPIIYLSRPPTECEEHFEKISQIKSQELGAVMTEQAYIIATNQIRVRAAIEILRDVLPGENWGVGKEQRGSILDELHVVSEQLSKAVKIKG